MELVFMCNHGEAVLNHKTFEFIVCCLCQFWYELQARYVVPNGLAAVEFISGMTFFRKMLVVDIETFEEV